MSYLVWIRGIHGRVEPQKWAELYYGVGDWKKPIVVAAYALSDAEAALKIDDVAKIYPLSEPEENEPRFKIPS